MQLTRNEIEHFTAGSGELYFQTGKIRKTGKTLELSFTIPAKVRELASFLYGVGYTIVTPPDGVRVVRTMDGAILGNPKFLPLEVAVSLYNRGNWYSVPGSGHLIETTRNNKGRTYCLRATAYTLATVYSSKRREKMQLQRCRKTEGGIK